MDKQSWYKELEIFILSLDRLPVIQQGDTPETSTKLYFMSLHKGYKLIQYYPSLTQHGWLESTLFFPCHLYLPRLIGNVELKLIEIKIATSIS